MTAPTLFVIANVSAPCSDAGRPMRYAVSAYADTLISSKKTNMLNRSPVSEKPISAPRNTRIRAWNVGPTASKNRHANSSATPTSPAASSASEAPSGSIAK